jgi:hypothetical protein
MPVNSLLRVGGLQTLYIEYCVIQTWPNPLPCRYPRPSVTVDNVIVAKSEGQTPAKVLLIQRKNSPCQVQHWQITVLMIYFISLTLYYARHHRDSKLSCPGLHILARAVCGLR